MIKFSEGDRVVAIANNRLNYGTIKTLYEGDAVVAVQFDGLALLKMKLDKLAPAPEEKAPEEKEGITITREELARKIAATLPKVIDRKDDPMMNAVLVLFGTRLGAEILIDVFGDSIDD